MLLPMMGLMYCEMGQTPVGHEDEVDTLYINDTSHIANNDTVYIVGLEDSIKNQKEGSFILKTSYLGDAYKRWSLDNAYNIMTNSYFNSDGRDDYSVDMSAHYYTNSPFNIFIGVNDASRIQEVTGSKKDAPLYKYTSYINIPIVTSINGFHRMDNEFWYLTKNFMNFGILSLDSLYVDTDSTVTSYFSYIINLTPNDTKF